MKHLTLETLARLVGEAPSASEREHLESCARCSLELAALTGQTQELAALSSVEPDPEAWDALADRLRREGLLREPARAVPVRSESVRPGSRDVAPGGAAPHPRSSSAHPSSAHPSSALLSSRTTWMRAAAGVLLFVGGGVLGAIAAPPVPRPATDGAPPREELGLADLTRPFGGLDDLSLDEAEALVRLTQEWHVDALSAYRSRLETASGGAVAGDPFGRLLVLENLVAVTEVGVRESPADPFLNGLLVSAVAERQAAWEGISFASGRVP